METLTFMRNAIIGIGIIAALILLVQKLTNRS